MDVRFDDEPMTGIYANYCSFNRLGVELSAAGIYEDFHDVRKVSWGYYREYIEKACALKPNEELVGIQVLEVTGGINIVLREKEEHPINKENFIHVAIRVSMLNYSEEVLYVGKDHDAAWEKIGQESPRWRYKMQTWHEGEKIMDDYVTQ